MDLLERQLQLELTRKVATDFKEPLGPLNALTLATMAPLGTYIGGCGCGILGPLNALTQATLHGSIEWVWHLLIMYICVIHDSLPQEHGIEVGVVMYKSGCGCGIQGLRAIMLLLLLLLDAQNRAENYATQSENFQAHSKKMAETATALAKSGIVTDKQLSHDLISTAKKVGRARRNWGMHGRV